MSRLREASREAAHRLELLTLCSDLDRFYTVEERDWMRLLSERMFEVNNRGVALEHR